MVSLVGNETVNEVIHIIKIKVSDIIKRYSKDKLHSVFKRSLFKSIIKYLIATLGLTLIRYDMELQGYLLLLTVIIYNVANYSINIYNYRVPILEFIKTRNLNYSITQYLYSEYGILHYMQFMLPIVRKYTNEIPENPIQDAVDETLKFLKMDLIKITSIYIAFFITGYLIIRPLLFM